MPPQLTLNDLETIAFACRAMARQEGKRAEAMENPTVRAPIEQAAQRYAELARRFEAAMRERRKRS